MTDKKITKAEMVRAAIAANVTKTSEIKTWITTNYKVDVDDKLISVYKSKGNGKPKLGNAVDSLKSVRTLSEALGESINGVIGFADKVSPEQYTEVVKLSQEFGSDKLTELVKLFSTK